MGTVGVTRVTQEGAAPRLLVVVPLLDESARSSSTENSRDSSPFRRRDASTSPSLPLSPPPPANGRAPLRSSCAMRASSSHSSVHAAPACGGSGRSMSAGSATNRAAARAMRAAGAGRGSATPKRDRTKPGEPPGGWLDWEWATMEGVSSSGALLGSLAAVGSTGAMD